MEWKWGDTLVNAVCDDEWPKGSMGYAALRSWKHAWMAHGIIALLLGRTDVA